MVGNTPRETRDLVDLRLPKSRLQIARQIRATLTKRRPAYRLPRLTLLRRTRRRWSRRLPRRPEQDRRCAEDSGMVLMPWLKNVRALLEAWFPGQDDGDVVADILFGVISPSGKLPVTFGNTAREAAYATEAQYPGVRENNGQPGGPGSVLEPPVSRSSSATTRRTCRWATGGTRPTTCSRCFRSDSACRTRRSNTAIFRWHRHRPRDWPRRLDRQIQDHQHRQQAGCRGIPGLSHAPQCGKRTVQTAGRLPESRSDARHEPGGHRRNRPGRPEPPAIFLRARRERDLGRWPVAHGRCTTPSRRNLVRGHSLQAAVNLCSVPVRSPMEMRSPSGGPNTMTGL